MWGGRPRPRRTPWSGCAVLPLLRRRQMRVAVALIAILARFRAHRTLLAVADHADPGFRNTQPHQKILGGSSAPVAQSKIVFGRAAFIAVSLNDHTETRIGIKDALEQVRVAGQRLTSVVAEIALVIIEIGVLSLPAQHLRSGNLGSGRRWRRGRRRHRNIHGYRPHI